MKARLMTLAGRTATVMQGTWRHLGNLGTTHAYEVAKRKLPMHGRTDRATPDYIVFALHVPLLAEQLRASQRAGR